MDHTRKQQSAMEYLMTYGWSILIIAIVLAALFSLGVFSNSNLGPRAQTNSCRVFRPNGPGTTTNINLEGVCNGELPEYVANIYSGSVSISSTPALSGLTTQMSVSLWLYPTATVNCVNPFKKNIEYNLYYGGPGGCLGSPTNHLEMTTNAGNTGVGGSSGLNLNQWYNAIWTYSSATGGIMYIDGVSQGAATGAGGLTLDPTNALTFAGGSAITYLSNVQVYNTTLDSNAVLALYDKGIGGAPIEPQNLVGWWPLNGDANDYSGNNQNGVQTGITFTSSWTSGYTTP